MTLVQLLRVLVMSYEAVGTELSTRQLGVPLVKLVKR